MNFKWTLWEPLVGSVNTKVRRYCQHSGDGRTYFWSRRRLWKLRLSTADATFYLPICIAYSTDPTYSVLMIMEVVRWISDVTLPEAQYFWIASATLPVQYDFLHQNKSENTYFRILKISKTNPRLTIQLFLNVQKLPNNLSTFLRIHLWFILLLME